jgi:tetratricopeptide (TPR) repeat protein
VFLTDHPLFYQPELFVQAGRNLDTFRERVVHLMITCVQAMNRGAAGDVQVARTRLAWCVKQAPRFTRAHMALADVLISLGRYQDARAQVADVLGYAPDHSLALYYAAYLEVQLERPEAARPYLTLLFAQERDPALLQKARALQSYIDNQSTIKPAPPQGG